MRLGRAAWLAGFLAAFPCHADPKPVDVPGSYDVLICKGPCGFGAPTNVVVKGVLVLAAAPISAQSLNRLISLKFEYAYGIGRDTNGCFVLDTIRQNQTYAGLIEFGLTLWRVHEQQVSFELYTSPDAGHFATVTMTSDGFQGTGGSSGGVVAEGEGTPDVLVAKRLGPAQIDTCVKAAEQRRRKSPVPYTYGLQPTVGAHSSWVSCPSAPLRAAGG